MSLSARWYRPSATRVVIAGCTVALIAFAVVFYELVASIPGRDARLARGEPIAVEDRVITADGVVLVAGQEAPKKKKGFWGRIFGR